MLGQTLGMLAMFVLLSLLCVIALCMMYVCIYIYIYIYSYVCVGDRALCMMDSCGYVSDPLWPWVLWTLWYEYVLKSIAVGAYSCHIVCIVTTVWSSRSMSPSVIGFPVYATRINVLNALRGSSSSWHEHVGMRHIHSHETLSVHHSAQNAKHYWIFVVKLGHPHCHILTSKSWWE